MPSFSEVLRATFDSIGDIREEISSKFRVPSWVEGVSSAFGSPCTEQSIATRDMLLLLILPVVLTAVLAFLNKRKKRWLYILEGRPGSTLPIDFLSESNANRWCYCMAFIVTGTMVCATTLNKLHFEWEKSVPPEFYILQPIVVGLYIGTLYYPLFASLSSKNVVGYAIGCLYAWMLLIISGIQMAPCFGGNWLIDVGSILGHLPMLLALLYLTITMPIRFAVNLRASLEKRRDPLAFLANQKAKELFIHNLKAFTVIKKKSHNFQYVERLLYSKACQKAEKEKAFQFERLHPFRTKLSTCFKKFIYSWDPTFRYSLTVLVGFTLSLVAVYQLFLHFLFFWIIKVDAIRHQFLGSYGSESNTTSIIVSLLGLFSELSDAFADDDEPAKNFPTSNAVNVSDIPEDSDTGTLTSGLRELVETEAPYWISSLKAVAICALTTAFCSTVLAVFFSLRSYKANLMEIRRGIFTDIPDIRDRKPRNILIGSCKYIGFQAAYAIWGFLLQATLFGLIFLTVTVICSCDARYDTSVSLNFIRAIWPFLVYPLILIILHQLIASFFLQRDERRNAVLAINNRHCFFNYNYFMIFLNVVMGLLSCIKLFFIAILSGTVFIVRLDVSTLSRGIETQMDPGFNSYLAMLVAQNAHCNPVLTVFVKLMWHQLLLRKTAQKLFHGNASSSKSGSHPLSLYRLHGEENASKLRAKTRWALAYTLLKNPALRPFRKHQLDNPKLLFADAIFSSASKAYANNFLADALRYSAKQERDEANVSSVDASRGWFKARQAASKGLLQNASGSIC